MKTTGTRTSQEMVTTMCHPGPISAPAHDPRPLSGLGMRAGATRWVLGSQCHQGTLRCPLLPLQPPRCLGSFSHLGGAQPSVVTHWPPRAPHGNALSPSPGSPGAPAHPRRFPECRDELIAIPAAFPLRKPQAFLRSPRCWFITPCPRQAGDSAPVPPRARRAGPAAAPARSHRTMSAGESTEPCRRSALACHRFPVAPPATLSVRLGFSVSIRSLSGSRASLGTSLSPHQMRQCQRCPTSRAWGQRVAGRSQAAGMQSPTRLWWGPQPPFAWSIPAGTGSCRAGRGRCDPWMVPSPCPGCQHGCGGPNLSP